MASRLSLFRGTGAKALSLGWALRQPVRRL